MRWTEEAEKLARQRLPEAVFRYVRQGSRDSVTAREAAGSWSRFRFRPHVLRDVTTVDLTTSVLGTPLRAPVAVSPTTLQRAAHPDGEIAMAEAVRDEGSLLVLSSNAGTSFADIGTTGVAWWLQAYLTDERDLCRPMLDAAVEAGARAVVLTVDTPVVGTKHDDGPTVWQSTDTSFNRMNLGEAADAPKATDLGPADIGWLTATTGLPVVVKGVLREDDARRAVEAGAAAVWVSNHGGRQLDRAASTASCLRSVVLGLGGAVEVYVDGGLRTGLDLTVALALGASAGFLGRVPLYALAADGRDGVRRALTEIAVELEESMRLAGVTRPGDLVEVLADPWPLPSGIE